MLEVFSTDMKKRLLELVIAKAFRYSEEPVFRLVSGKMSNYYFNCKAVTLSPEGMYLTGNLIFDLIKDLRVKGIGGLTLGADPIANAVAYTSYLKGNPVEAFVVRKTAKSHGTMQWIEGNVTKADRVVIVDGLFVGIECKADKTKKPTRLQQNCMQQIEAAGGKCFLVYDDETIEEVRGFIHAYRKGQARTNNKT